ncbi:MAG TPA: ribosome biogenesis GTP-binding protein YihA/YsxC [Candidatus Megaira endosymbiont of Stentor roeselii]|nr:ribosome biogenesis GTP-binding protein YihA/YsxC [Candidatus Megaera endosymbiont of Stentor roeselii]
MANELGTKIFRQEARFIAGAAKPSQLPKMFLPQVAFVGKSNVGKSSLINTICRRKNLARVSHTPGRTRQINFFLIAEKLVIADLPGYGFAKVPVEEKQNWEKLILHYLQNSPTLKLVNLLIDARRGIKENDFKVIQLLHSYDKQIQLVFTKADKVKFKEGFEVEIKNYLASLGYLLCNVILSSSKNGVGAKELQLSLAQYVK